MNKKSTGLLLSILGVLSVVLITAGVTFAFFNYAREGSTENTVTTGSITFLYTENSGTGRGISLTNAFPISDEVGKAQTGAGNVFEFKVTSTTPNKTTIPYEITARKATESTLTDDTVVKLYLTKVSGDSEEEVLLNKYSALTQTEKVSSSKYTEKTLYTEEVPANSSNYEQAYRLRMWIDEKTDFSNGSMNNKTFKVTVNVYANATVVSDEVELTYYYEFGTPTTSSTTDYTTLGKNVFNRLGSDDSHGVCINDNGLFCIKTNDYDNSVASMKAHFGESSCTDSGPSVTCNSGVVSCYASSLGSVRCDDYSTNENCNAGGGADGFFRCN